MGKVRPLVSIHAPVQGATRCARSLSPELRFNPRPCARGDPIRCSLPCSLESFNPRPCARGDGLGLNGENQVFVSIHAPVQGATLVIMAGVILKQFQSTPLCKGRPPAGLFVAGGIRFNPRPCARGDSLVANISLMVSVSIHAPVQGATRIYIQGGQSLRVSIHAPVQGATAVPSMFAGSYQFQSTPLCKGRQDFSRDAPAALLFQSTPLCKGRRLSGVLGVLLAKFQSTPLCKGRRLCPDA